MLGILADEKFHKDMISTEEADNYKRDESQVSASWLTAG